MDGDEELLRPPGPRMPRWMRIGALTLAGLAVLALVAVKAWPRSRPSPQALPTASDSRPPTASPTTPGAPPWPTARGACDYDVQVPIVVSTPARERAGIHVLLGGDRLRSIDLNSGHRVDLPLAPPGEYITGLYGAGYFATASCDGTRSHLFHLGPGKQLTNVTPPRPLDNIYVDATHAWGVGYPNEQRPHGYVQPLPGGPAVRLLAGFFPTAVAGGLVAGNGMSATGSAGLGPLLLVDATTGHIRTNLGVALTLAAGHGTLLWISGCTAASSRPCTVHRRTLATGATRIFRLPRPPGITPGVLSPDGSRVAFTLERAAPDPRYSQDHPIPPSDIAVLDLRTGRLATVPGIELPAKTSPGIAFSTDSHWLAIALNAGPDVRLLTWHPGLARPYEQAPITSATFAAPPLIATTN